VSGPQNITLIVNQLYDGGAARVAVYLANAWAERERRVLILTTDLGQAAPFYPLHPGVAHQAMDLRAVSRNPLEAVGHNFSRLVQVRRHIRASRPDLLVSFLDRNNIMCLLATRGMRSIPTIISERTDPHGRSIGGAWAFLRRLTYPWADCLVTQSAHAMAYFPASVRGRGRVIPNPVYRPPAAAPADARRERPRILALGRLHRIKGHDLLVDAFALIAERFPDWELCIHGDGPERDSLQARIQAQGLADRITLGPNIADVGSSLRDADLFVLPSRVEGFPNALAEAMAWGLPVVSFDCASGPGELIRHDWDGLLVPPLDVPALAAAMGRLMADPGERARLGARAVEVLTRFSAGRVMDLWESAIQSAMGSSTRSGQGGDPP
jgi:glycosyltransferase involved in cell wall biosynthesis